MFMRTGWLLAAAVGLSVAGWAGEGPPPGGDGPRRPRAERPERPERGERGGREGAGNPEEYKGDAEGTSAGTVTRIMPMRHMVMMRLEDGTPRMFMPRWIGGVPKDGGGYDQAVKAQIKALKEGDRIEIKWKWEEGFRAVKITVTQEAEPKAKDAAKERRGERRERPRAEEKTGKAPETAEEPANDGDDA